MKHTITLLTTMLLVPLATARTIDYPDDTGEPQRSGCTVERLIEKTP